MKDLILNSNPKVELVFASYPDAVRSKMLALRRLVLKTAAEIDEVSTLEETLKWGEPSYIAKTGSTLRMDWKPRSPDQYALYFKCTSRLVETFKSVFRDKFSYEGNRAIVFNLEDRIPEKELKECIRVTLTYHMVKKLPALSLSGIE